MFHVPELNRITRGPMASAASDGNNGAFMIQIGKQQFAVIASDGAGCEHVSASLLHRTPTWEEMCAIKAIFWDSDDCVMQLHPPKDESVNLHPHCLHLCMAPNRPCYPGPTVAVGRTESAHEGQDGMNAPPDTPDPLANNELIASLYQQLSKLHGLGIEHDSKHTMAHTLSQCDAERQVNRWVEAARRPPR